ncbi:MAG: 16S rRNA (cytosine(1402)-N(4))-methyltransferase RsmH [Patescibacteria group bacterium]
MEVLHQPVLLREVLDIFDPQPGERYIDATVNGGGHASAILEKIAPDGRVLGIDWDAALIERLRIEGPKIKMRGLEFVCGNYADIGQIAVDNGFQDVHGVLFDLGFSSYHVDLSGRGFSFLRDEPLDMRYHTAPGSKTAHDLINSLSEDELEKIFHTYGDERFSRRIASAITKERRVSHIRTTAELVGVIKRALPRGMGRGKIHPATRIFQALRIAVNREWDNIEHGIEGALRILARDGKVIVISFHSGEDSIVKGVFRRAAGEDRIKILTPRPMRPTVEDVRSNPRARSARLRAAIKIK